MDYLEIGNRKIGKLFKPLVIAEIGINHEGDINKAKKMVDDAISAGCECIKFQSHILDKEMIPNKVIPGNSKDSIWDIIKRCSLTFDEEKKLKSYVEKKGKIFLSTPFSKEAAFNLNKLGVCAFKIGSGECNNLPLIEYILKFKKPILLSTGMNDISMIEKSVKLIQKKKIPFILMHCVSIYPTPYEKASITAVKQLKKKFKTDLVGLSDHSIGNYISFGAVALGARVIERHFTSKKNWKGPDIPISINKNELKDLIEGCNAIHEGNKFNKQIFKEEGPTIKFAYSSVVAVKNIKKNEKITTENTWVKRPGNGKIKAFDYHKILGLKLKRNVKINEQIEWKDLNK